MSEHLIPIMAEPRKGHTDDEVVDTLQRIGATDIKILAEGFISAKLSKNKFHDMECIAHVHIKPTHQFL